MRYTLRPGLVLENVYGKHLLIADEKARKHCKYLTILDDSAAEILHYVIKGTSIEEMAKTFAQEYKDEEQEILTMIESFLQQMNENHFLVQVLDEDNGRNY